MLGFPILVLRSLSEFGMPVELRQVEDTLQASKVRVAENLPKYFSEDLGVELGRAVLAYRENHNDDDEHYLWHKQPLLINVLHNTTFNNNTPPYS